MAVENIEGLGLPYGVKPVNAVLVQAWSGPYQSLQNAKDTIPSGVRVQTMLIHVLDDVKLYWFKNGVTNDDLVPFFDSDSGGGLKEWDENREYTKGEAILYEDPNSPGYYTIYVAKQENTNKIPPDNTGDWGVANDGAFVPINGNASIKDTKSFERVIISDNLNFTAVEPGIGLHYFVRAANKWLALNRFPSSTEYDEDNDIVRYYSELLEMAVRWKFKLQSVDAGDTDDELLLISDDGEVKKISFSELVVTTTDTPEEDSEEAFNAGGAFLLQAQITGLSDNKLDKTDYQQHFRGRFPSLVSLENNVFTPPLIAGDYAQVDEGVGEDVKNYNWDADDEEWIEGGSGSAATDTDMLPEGSTNLYFTVARVLATLLTGYSVGSNVAIAATDTVLQAFGKVQAQINAKQNTLTFDSSPTSDSTNPVTSGGVFTALGDKLTGTLAADADLQTQTTPTEDNKFVSRRGLIYWWNWLRTQTATITARWQFTGIGIGTAGVTDALLILAASTASVASMVITWGAAYTGTRSGSIWGETTGFRLRILRGTTPSDILFSDRNTLFEGDGIRVAEFAPDGSLIGTSPSIEAWVFDTDLQDDIVSATYDGTGRATVTGILAGQEYDDGTYSYKAYADNQVRRW